MSSPQDMSLRPPTRLKVLVVDDDPVILEVVRERLREAGYDVHIREDALGTSQWVAREQPDFVILDVMMPALGGGELGQLLKRSSFTNQTAVILHSGMTTAALAPIMARTSALGAIAKTHDGERFLSEFQTLVDKHLAQRREERIAHSMPVSAPAPRTRPSELGGVKQEAAKTRPPEPTADHRKARGSK